MKNIKSLILNLIIFSGSIFYSNAQAPQFNLTCGTVVPNICSGATCGSVTVPLTASGVIVAPCPGLSGLSLELDYDGSILDFCGLTNLNPALG